MNKHDKIYAVLLVLLCVIWLSLAAIMMVMSTLDKVLMTFYSIMIALTLTTLILRLRFPNRARLFTKAFNIILIPILPLGTMVSIYGLTYLDRKSISIEADPKATITKSARYSKRQIVMYSLAWSLLVFPVIMITLCAVYDVFVFPATVAFLSSPIYAIISFLLTLNKFQGLSKDDNLPRQSMVLRIFCIVYGWISGMAASMALMIGLE